MSHLYSALRKTLSNSLIDDLIWMICEYAQLWSFEKVKTYNLSGIKAPCVSDSILYYIRYKEHEDTKLVIESISNYCLYHIHSFNIAFLSYDVSVSDLYIYLFRPNFQRGIIIDVYDKKTYIHRGEHRLMGYSPNFFCPRSVTSYKDGYIYVFKCKLLFSYELVNKLSESDLNDSVKYTNITEQIESHVNCIQGAFKYNYYGTNPTGEKEYLTSAYFYVFPNSSFSLLYQCIKLDDNILLVHKENQLIFMNKVLPKKPNPQSAIMELFSDVKKMIFN